MSSNCALCKNKFKSVFIDEVDDAILQKNSIWYQWERNENDGQTEKVERKENVHQLLNMLETKLRQFLNHYFINKRLSEAYNSCKVLATSESLDTVIVQMDFSEKFSCIYQDEVSSAHWKTNSVTLYTVMIWFREHKISNVLLSDSSNHNKTTVVPYAIHVLDYIWETFRADVKRVEVWTDGPSSQFKNKFIFAFIGIIIPMRYEFKVTRNYSATSHGKGVLVGSEV